VNHTFSFASSNYTGAKQILAKHGKSSHLSPTWKWGVLCNDNGDVVLTRSAQDAVAYAQHMWGSHCNFVLIRYCTNGNKS
jgi:hypothetical protein